MSEIESQIKRLRENDFAGMETMRTFALGIIDGLRGCAPCTRDREALANLVYEAIRFADWAAGQSISPATSQPALDPVDFINAYGEATGVWHDEKLAEHVRGLIVAPLPQTAAMTSKALSDIAAERQRQISVEGWSPQHDDEHEGGQIAAAAGVYALVASERHNDIAKQYWPWDFQWWKPCDARRNLVKAGALIAAEIDRLDRIDALARNQGQGGGPRS